MDIRHDLVEPGAAQSTPTVFTDPQPGDKERQGQYLYGYIQTILKEKLPK